MRLFWQNFYLLEKHPIQQYVHFPCYSYEIQPNYSTTSSLYQRLAIPQRRLICRAVVTEIDQLTSRPSFKNKRRRLVFVFSDQVIICKKRGGDQLDYRGSFSLMDAIAISFETHRKSLIFDNIRIMVQPLTKYILQIKDTYL